jgi:hypothetical protein
VDYKKAVSETWRHCGFTADNKYMNLVRYATLAASSHNTQPWKFILGSERISILPDLSRRCPAVDPDDHHLFASLGCAVENLLWAAKAAGLLGHLSYDSFTSTVQVDLEEAPPSRSAIFEAIPNRQCSRAEYDGTDLTGEQLNLLENAGSGNGVSLLLLTANKDREQVAEYVAQGNTAQFGDPRWAYELRTWVRFNSRDAVRTRDGLYGPVMGSPDVPRWLGQVFMRLALSAKNQNRKDIKNIRSSAAIAVFFSDDDDKRHWIEAGRCYQRFALQAAALNLRTAFINQPVEVPALRPQFAASLGIGKCRPDLVVRIGHGPEMPRSLRRPLEQVLV